MKVGAEPKKVAALAVLGVAGAYLFYSNVLSTPSSAPAPKSATAARIMGTPAAVPPAAATPAPSGPNIRRARPITGRGGSNDFRPSVKTRPEDAANLANIDPTLRNDLIAKVRAVERTGGERNLFQFGSAPPPPPPPGPKVEVGKIKPGPLGGPATATVKTAGDSGKPGDAAKALPANIPLRYFGYATPKQTGIKRAFFMDGDDIQVAGEGEIIRKRYKVIRIGVNSVTMEDMESKNQQTLMILQEQAAGTTG